MKKTIALILAVFMLFSASACMKNKEDDKTPPVDDTTVLSPENNPDESDFDEDITGGIVTGDNDVDTDEEQIEDKPQTDDKKDTSSSKPQNKPSDKEPSKDEDVKDDPITGDDEAEDNPVIKDDETDDNEGIYISDSVYFKEYFHPALRFAVASDVHFDDSGSEVQEGRLEKMFDIAYNYASSQEYAALDGAFFVGDFTNRGTEISMQKFFDALTSHAKEETITHAPLGNHEYGAGEMTHERYLRISGYENIHEHKIIGGYHFLFLSPDRNSGMTFSEDARKWLEENLQIAADDDESGSRPIFVFQHEHIRGTVYGSEDWGVDDLTDILEKYPQVIDFSGHSHYPMNDPRTIWQGTFTALGTSTLSYYEMGIAGMQRSGIFHTDYEGGYANHAHLFDAAQFYIVEVDENNAVKIIGYDITAGKFMDDVVYCLRSVKSIEDFRYTDERKTSSQVPYFEKNTAICAEEILPTSAKIRFGQAVCKDDVQNYIVNLYKDGEFISSQRRLACTFMDPAPEELTVTFDSLTPGETYNVEIIAVSSWEKLSEPVTFEFTTEDVHDTEINSVDLSALTSDEPDM